jgi:hypothetical protein
MKVGKESTPVMVADLPAEMLHLVLNGTDVRGVAFFDARQRPIAALVCKRWRAIIAKPSRAVAHGHLAHVPLWKSIDGDYDDPHLRRHFKRGRLITAYGLVGWLVDRVRAVPDGTTADIDRLHACMVHDLACLIPTAVAQSALSHTCLRYKPAPAHDPGVPWIVAHVAGTIVREGAWSVRTEDVDPYLGATLVDALGGAGCADAAMRLANDLLAQRVFMALTPDVVTSWATKTVTRARDDPHAILALLLRSPPWQSDSARRCTRADRLMRALARAGAVRTIRVLAREVGYGTDASDHARGPHQRSRTPPIDPAIADSLRDAMRDARRQRGSGGVLHDIVRGPDPTGVVGALGGDGRLVRAAIAAALEAGRPDVADALSGAFSRFGSFAAAAWCDEDDGHGRDVVRGLLANTRVAPIIDYLGGCGWTPSDAHIDAVLRRMIRDGGHHVGDVVRALSRWPDALRRRRCNVAYATVRIPWERTVEMIGMLAPLAPDTLPHDPEFEMYNSAWAYLLIDLPRQKEVLGDLARFALMLDPTTNPSAWRAWRFWVGAPRPLSHDRVTGAVLTLARLGAFSGEPPSLV